MIYVSEGLSPGLRRVDKQNHTASWVVVEKACRNRIGAIQLDQSCGGVRSTLEPNFLSLFAFKNCAHECRCSWRPQEGAGSVELELQLVTPGVGAENWSQVPLKSSKPSPLLIHLSGPMPSFLYCVTEYRVHKKLGNRVGSGVKS